MAKLIGAQRLVLQAILDLPKDFANNVTDTQIAGATMIALDDVRNWLKTPKEQGYVDIIRTTVGLNASETAQGRLILRQYAPFSLQTPGSVSVQAPTSAPPTPMSPPGSTSHLSGGRTQLGQTASSQTISSPSSPITIGSSYVFSANGRVKTKYLQGGDLLHKRVALFVEALPETLVQIDRITYKLPNSYPNPHRQVSRGTSNFCLEIWACDDFLFTVVIFLKNGDQRSIPARVDLFCVQRGFGQALQCPAFGLERKPRRRRATPHHNGRKP